MITKLRDIIETTKTLLCEEAKGQKSTSPINWIQYKKIVKSKSLTRREELKLVTANNKT